VRTVRTPPVRRTRSAVPGVSLRIEVPDPPIPEERLRRDVVRALRLAGFGGSLSLAIVDDRVMRRVNRDFHAADRATDVLAFPLGGGPGGAFDAEVVVSADTARREAAKRGVTPASELMLYVVHGVLHLLGEDDHDPADAARMHERSLSILAALGHANTIGAPRARRGPARTR